jgi:L-alanine-DL-glutamate epimerase-like enolase superfamily enzyme
VKITAIQAIPIRGTRDYVTSAGLKTPESKAAPPKTRALTSGYASRRHVCAYPRGYQTTLVRVYTDAGIIGIGEAHSPLAPQVSATIVEHVLAPALIGQDPRAVDVLWEKMYSTMRLRGHSTGWQSEAMSGVDIALWDILGKAVGLPVYMLLGGAFHPRLKAYASGVPGTTTDQQVAHARRFVEQDGFTAVKMSIGRKDLEVEIAAVAALAQALGNEAHLLVDAHGAYDATTALNLGRQMQDLGVYWLEDPLPPEDHSGDKMLSDALDMAIAAGETECNRYQFRDRLAERAVDVLLPDICRAGGISEGRKIAHLADCYNTPWAAHVSMGSPVHIAAALHLGAATPNFLICECPTHENPLGNNLLKTPIRCENGFFELPQGPGLGIELIEDELDKVRLE